MFQSVLEGNWLWMGLLIASYLFGSISFSRLIVAWRAPGTDLTALAIPMPGMEEGEAVLSGIGANTASIAVGPVWGIVIALLDMIKVALPTLAAMLLSPDTSLYLIISLAGIAGHNWPIWYRFKGGVGLSSSLGALLVIEPLAALVCPIAATLLSAMLTGSPLMGDVLWLVLLIPWMWYRTGQIDAVLWAAGLFMLYMLATIPLARIYVRLRREGRLDAYLEGLLASSGRWRAMDCMAKRLYLLGFLKGGRGDDAKR